MLLPFSRHSVYCVNVWSHWRENHLCLYFVLHEIFFLIRVVLRNISVMLWQLTSRLKVDGRELPADYANDVNVGLYCHPRSAVVTLSVASVCLSVCNTITFESLDVGSSFLILWGYGSSSYLKVVGSRERSQAPKTPNSLFPRSKTLIGNISAVCVQHGVFTYGGSNGVMAILVT